MVGCQMVHVCPLQLLIILKGNVLFDSAAVYCRCLCLFGLFCFSIDIKVVSVFKFMYFTLFQHDIAQMEDDEICEDISKLWEKHNEQVVSQWNY